LYPNPQDALPLPLHPSPEQYEALAKDLVTSCRSADPAAVGRWARQWIETLATLQRETSARGGEGQLEPWADRVAEFARRTLAGGDTATATGTLADARWVIARVHGFGSWPELMTQIESSDRAGAHAAMFEAGASAVVAGDISTIERLLREFPELIRLRSLREHRATLLHYVSANGVEGYRQVSPKNIPEITRVLLAAGAEVDAEADVYGGRCTALGLVATSAPPFDAGVQRAVIDVLLDHGARMDRPGVAGRKTPLIHACLANGQLDAAEYLVSRGAPLDLVGAAGLGRVDVVSRYFDEGGNLRMNATTAELMDGFSLACAYGRAGAVDFLLDRGMDVDAELRLHGDGHTGLHVAAFHGHVAVVEALLRGGARVEALDRTWRTPPLVWALTGWTRKGRTEAGSFSRVVARLVGAGAKVTPDLLEWDEARSDPGMLAALTGNAPQTPHDPRGGVLSGSD
jgi:hypothetical protein